MLRPRRLKERNFGFNSDSDDEISQNQHGFDSGGDDLPAFEKHQSKGLLKKIGGFLKRIKPGRKKSKELCSLVSSGGSSQEQSGSGNTASFDGIRGSENWILLDVSDTTGGKNPKYSSDEDTTGKPNIPRSHSFSCSGYEFGSLDDGTKYRENFIVSGYHTDYGSVGGYSLTRTTSVTVSDKISLSLRDQIGSGNAASFAGSRDLMLVKRRFNKPSPDDSSGHIFHESSSLSSDSSEDNIYDEQRLDISADYSDDAISVELRVDLPLTFYEVCKGFPFNVARQLAIKFNIEEGFVVPATNTMEETMFIIYDKEQGRDRFTTELDQKVLFRNPKSVQSEGLEIANYCIDNKLYINPKERAFLQRIIQKHTDKLFKSHSNINFISTSPVKSSKNGNDVRNKMCIVIYCSSKGYVPSGEANFPTELTLGKETVLTDIREGYFQFGPFAYPTSRSSDPHDRLKMGCQFGVEGGQMTGTIGPFVSLNGQMAFLTCAHIIYGIDENGYRYNDPVGNTNVEQPPSANFGSSGRRCGKVKRAVFGPRLPSSVDAAVVEITEPLRRPLRGEFAIDIPVRLNQAGFDDLPHFNSGRTHPDPNTIDSDKRMVKFGSETHVTRGTLISEGTVVTPVSTEMGLFGNTGKKVLMRNQMEISGLTSHGAFFQPGDSGSGVFFVDRTNAGHELTCIGMAIGSTSNGTAIVTPIASILDALQLPTSLWQFP